MTSLGHPCKFQRVSCLDSVTARHSSSGRQPSFAALNRGRHLYSAGQPSRWAKMVWRVWGTPAKFNGFCLLASLLHRRRSTEINQTLHDVWPSPGLVHYIHFWRLLSRNGILTGEKFTLRPNLAFFYIGSVTARHSSSGRQPNCDV